MPSQPPSASSAGSWQLGNLSVNRIGFAAMRLTRDADGNPGDRDRSITSKAGPGRDPSGDWFWATPGQPRGQVEENLRQLGRDHLDVVNLCKRGKGSIAEHFGALADMRAAGLIRHLGISNVAPDRLVEGLAIAPVVCVQNQYGIGASRESDDFLHTCGEQRRCVRSLLRNRGRGTGGRRDRTGKQRGTRGRVIGA